LDEDDLALVMCSEHRPNCLIQLMTQSLRQVLLQDSERSLLDANISQFNDSISVCERLIRTPIPLSYTRLTSRILVLWHLTLPVVLWDDCKLMVIPATFISAACLFCIEEVTYVFGFLFPFLVLFSSLQEKQQYNCCFRKHHKSVFIVSGVLFARIDNAL
jgi:putative membrane protein